MPFKTPTHFEHFTSAHRLTSLAAPLMLQNVFGYSLAVVSAVFVGHLNDPLALSSTVLAGSFYNVTGFSVIVGLAAGMETLCGQVRHAMQVTYPAPVTVGVQAQFPVHLLACSRQ